MSDHHVRIVLAMTDVVSALTIIGSIAGVVPWMAAFLCAIWYVIQIYESQTFQKWLKRSRHDGN